MSSNKHILPRLDVPWTAFLNLKYLAYTTPMLLLSFVVHIQIMKLLHLNCEISTMSPGAYAGMWQKLQLMMQRVNSANIAQCTCLSGYCTINVLCDLVLGK